MESASRGRTLRKAMSSRGVSRNDALGSALSYFVTDPIGRTSGPDDIDVVTPSDYE